MNHGPFLLIAWRAMTACVVAYIFVCSRKRQKSVVTLGLAEESGRRVAAVLTGAWRDSPPAVDFSAEDLEEASRLLLQSGAGALAWWRIRDTPSQNSKAANEFRQSFRLNTLESRISHSHIEKVFGLLRSSGVEPILVKGAAVARFYPQRGLRPYGDIDLCVRPRQFAAAQVLMKKLGELRGDVDLHNGFTKMGG